MKIGIVTHFNAPNYGAMLQAYALQTHLQARGHGVVFFDNVIRVEKYTTGQLFSPLSLKSFRTKLARNMDIEMFQRFQHHFATTQRYDYISSVLPNPPDCDCFIVGSDQVWNVDIHQQHLQLVFLDAFPSKALRVAYAASFGRPVPDKVRAEIGGYLKNFSAISVREKNAVEWVRELSGKEAEWVCDPTLLCESEQYDALLPESPADVEAPYVFSYLLVPVKRHPTKAVAKHLGIKRVKTHLRGGAMMFGVQAKIGIEEWLQRIKRASLVITNSYHGTLFAIIYKKPFLTLPLKGDWESRNDRIFSVLGKLGLENRIYDASNPAALPSALDSPIDWDDVRRRLAAWRKKTDAFFHGAGCHGVFTRNHSEGCD